MEYLPIHHFICHQFLSTVLLNALT